MIILHDATHSVVNNEMAVGHADTPMARGTPTPKSIL
jgi:hypothetical protein